MNGMGRKKEQVDRANDNMRMALGIGGRGVKSPHLQAMNRKKDDEERIREVFRSAGGSKPRTKQTK